jgi:hypothetical protein
MESSTFYELSFKRTASIINDTKTFSTIQYNFYIVNPLGKNEKLHNKDVYTVLIYY